MDGWTQEEMRDFIEEHQIPCPTCGKHNFTDIRQFNLMFKTFQGVTEDAKNTNATGKGDAPVEDATRKFDFGELQFGTEYDPKDVK